MKRILLITLGLSAFLWADFTRDANGIVTDSTTTLEWQDNELKTALFEDAIVYCEALDLGGIGWRLPNINELKSIIDDSKTIPAINSIFVNTANNNYGSSTTAVGNVNNFWYVNFTTGVAYPNAVKAMNLRYIRCVRG